MEIVRKPYVHKLRPYRVSIALCDVYSFSSASCRHHVDFLWRTPPGARAATKRPVSLIVLVIVPAAVIVVLVVDIIHVFVAVRCPWGFVKIPFDFDVQIRSHFSLFSRKIRDGMQCQQHFEFWDLGFLDPGPARAGQGQPGPALASQGQPGLARAAQGQLGPGCWLYPGF